MAYFEYLRLDLLPDVALQTNEPLIDDLARRVEECLSDHEERLSGLVRGHLFPVLIYQIGECFEQELALVEFMNHLTDERVKFRKAPFDHPELVLPNGHTGVENGVALDDNFVLPAVGREGGDPFMPFEEALEAGY